MSSRRIAKSVRNGALLFWNLGFRRFSIVVVYWALRRYRPAATVVFDRAFGTVNRNHISRDPVLMYQMPKVGSTSLLYSVQFAYLKAGLPQVALHHVHTLTNLDLHEQIATKSDNPAEQLALVREYKKIRHDIESQSEGHWTAISMIRDPVARQISDYFHNIDSHIPDWRKRWREQSLSVDEVLRNFLTLPDHTPNWFEAEVQSVLGIDVYASAFPHEAGYIVCSGHPKVKLMVMRLEDMNRVAGQAIEQLLGV
ncbi:MAG TPA: putative capsular polysaccharide synthesis family protein, partial [Tepidisphaeraceae bacterium]